MATTRSTCPYAIAEALRAGRLSPEEVGVDQIASLASVVSSLSVTYGVRTINDGVVVAVYWYPDPETAYAAFEGMREAADADVTVELVTCQRSQIVGSDFLPRGRSGVQETENH